MNPPEILHLDVSLVDKAISVLKSGQLVAFPTETVYGLGADATNGEAVARIYALKSRPQFNPLIVHVANAATAQRYVVWNPIAEALAGAFWPGPLTLVLQRRADCPISDLVSAGGNTLGVRVPSHPVARQLLEAWGGGIAAPSANRSGRISPTTAQHVRDEFGDAALLIVDGGACDIGIESTVVDCTGTAPVMLRPGAITEDQLSGVSGQLRHQIHHSPFTIHHPPLLSPGQLAAHYAPSIPVRLNATAVTSNEALLAFGAHELPGAAHTLNLSPRSDLVEAAANLFRYLRMLDTPKFSAIAVMPIPGTGIGIAINDRLTRAEIGSKQVETIA